MNSIESAYEQLGSALLSSSDGGWSELRFSAKILGTECSSMSTIQITPEGEPLSVGLGFSNGFRASDAAVFMRDEMLRSTGHRIWGLTFTLFPNGKFKLTYDYDKPEGYEETEEPINLKNALATLGNMGIKVEGSNS